MSKYNGYKNYQTWALKLVIDIHETTYRHYMNDKQQLLSECENVEECCL